ncbi:MAG: hypothetical protein EHM42_15570, partial [Planctomycetaceae bacterium]
MGATLTLDDLTAFNAELSALVRAGIPLEPGLSALASEHGGALGRVCGSVAEQMRQGVALDA